MSFKSFNPVIISFICRLFHFPYTFESALELKSQPLFFPFSSSIAVFLSSSSKRISLPYSFFVTFFDNLCIENIARISAGKKQSSHLTFFSLCRLPFELGHIFYIFERILRIFEYQIKIFVSSQLREIISLKSIATHRIES